MYCKHVSPGWGLSPRVRGNHARLDAGRMGRGSIPACAGEPCASSAPVRIARVYPRVCGGTTARAISRCVIRGLSPRVRGNRAGGAAAARPSGSIPACAGEPGGDATPTSPTTVYPRVCGGTRTSTASSSVIRGLSPRVRGNLLPIHCSPSSQGSIPACAGEPIWPWALAAGWWVYPRVCGGTAPARFPPADGRGLSPRVRGNRAHPGGARRSVGSIPACAGEPPARRAARRSARVYPRVCGGTDMGGRLPTADDGLSPRVRGNHRPKAGVGVGYRSIPACAGELGGGGRAPGWRWVYPRVCGGTGAKSASR